MLEKLKKVVAVRLIRNRFFREYIFRLYSPAIEWEYKELGLNSFETLVALLNVESSPFELVRHGINGDGGYVIANNLNKNDFLISFGVGTETSFEESISKEILGIHLYDHTIKDLSVEIENAIFTRSGISIENSANMVNLDEAVSRVPNCSDLILKMDVEGDEWAVLDSIEVDTLKMFKQIILEFHNLESINLQTNLQKFQRVFTKLNVSHRVINVHGNNWDSFKVIHGQIWANALEITYLRKNFFQNSEINSIKKLNYPNNPNRADLNLGF